MDTQSQDRWLSATELCQYLSISNDTLYRWIRQDDFPAQKIGMRWKALKSHVDEWVALRDAITKKNNPVTFRRLKGVSLFAGAGIGETYLSEIGVDIIVANELIKCRADLYQHLYQKCNMICGDITSKDVFSSVLNKAQGVDFMIASPPCQGMSVAGKSRHEESMLQDSRNYLIIYAMDMIEKLLPKYVLIENVPMLLKIQLPYKDKLTNICDILRDRFGNKYCIDGRIVDAADYGVPQTRLRTIIKMYPINEVWPWPSPVSSKKSVQDAIGHLPSLEAGERSMIKWHFARKHDPKHILWMKHTPTGKSAYSNDKYYPQHDDGTKIKGYESSYRRIRWDTPAPTITMRNDAISSQRNVHPGRLLKDGTYSDARVLTPLEIMLLDSLPANWNIPDDTPEILIRQVIGESIPPLMVKKIVGELPCLK